MSLQGIVATQHSRRCAGCGGEETQPLVFPAGGGMPEPIEGAWIHEGPCVPGARGARVRVVLVACPDCLATIQAREDQPLPRCRQCGWAWRWGTPLVARGVQWVPA